MKKRKSVQINLPFLSAENPWDIHGDFFLGKSSGLCGQYLYSVRICFLFCVHVNVPLCKCVFVQISWCISANAYKYLCISLSVFVCVLVFVHLAQGLVRVEAAIIPSNDYY